MDRKGFTPIVALLVIVGLLVLAGIWYYEAYKTPTKSVVPVSSNQAQSTSTTPNVNWATYTSPLGFSFEYPANMEYEVAVDGSVAVNPFGNGSEIDIEETPLNQYSN